MQSRYLLLLALTLVSACDRRRRSDADRYADRMRDAIPAIEKATGLTFKTPPILELRSRAQVRDFLVAKFDESSPAAQLRGEEIAYKQFGLLPDTLDLRRFLLELLTEQIVGYYDPATKVLYIVEGAPADLAGVTVTHELIHALQDQYISLDSIQKLEGNSDQLAAAQAVLEGQATFEQLSIMLGGNVAARLPGGWESVRETIRQAQASMPLFSAAPMAIQESLLFPYLSGAEFIRRHKARMPQGNPLMDLPVSTEQVLSEEAYFDEERDMPTTVMLPGDRQGEHEETMGEFGTRLLIFEHTKNHTVAVGAARGWDGDRYRIIGTGAGRGLTWVTVWDSPLDAAQFVDAIGQAIVRRYGTPAPSVARTGARTYAGASRTVVVTPGEVQGRNVVLYVDVPRGAPTAVLDLNRVRLDP
ncbi:MAG: hypothetical protein WD801_13730 [Gemmatimonadaceae bacterium]